LADWIARDSGSSQVPSVSIEVLQLALNRQIIKEIVSPFL